MRALEHNVPARPRSFLSTFFASLRCAFLISIAGLAFCLSPLRAQEIAVTLDPATTKIDFTLAATMHTVHGTLKLKSGQIHFDAATGKASGAIVVDATSADTANGSRDKKMHGEILESAKFPEIIFTPKQITGSLKELLAQQGTAQVEVSGSFRLHGQDHDATLTISVEPGAAGHVRASTKFPVPYVKWGLKDPSTFILHVSDTVDVEVQAAGQIAPATPSAH